MGVNSILTAEQESVVPSARQLQPQRTGLLAVGLILCGTALLLLGLGFGGQSNGVLGFYLLPWMALVAVIALTPAVYLYYKRRLVFYHPLVYGVVRSVIPEFVIGPIAIALNMHDTYAYSLISDPQFYLPLALIYVALGLAGLAVGFALPIGPRIGRKVFAKVPAGDWSFEEVWVPALLLLAIGQVGTLAGLQAGSVGYQLTESPSLWGQTLTSLSAVGGFAQLVLWFTIFRARRRTPVHWLVIIILIAYGGLNALLSGGKGGVFEQVFVVLAVYFLAGRRLRLRYAIVVAVIAVPLIVLGVSYGNTFRGLKGSESTVDVADYAGFVSDATGALFASDLGDSLASGAESFFQRMEIITHLGVIVSKYERLAPLEEQYGLANNIMMYTLTGFIPRFVWPEKPVISDTRAVAALYFNRPDTSYAITPFGDLLRNFGPVGVPVGMAILGVVFAAIYQLVARQPTTAWRAGLYYALLVTVSYEGFYGTILPGMLRAGVTVAVGTLFLRFFIGKLRNL